MWEGNIKKYKVGSYVDIGHGKPIVLLYGLFGNIHNYSSFIPEFSKKYRVIVPILPIHNLGMHVSVVSLTEFIVDLINYLQIKETHLVGNSLGGHIALLLTLSNPDKVKTLTLVGSSGLFENGMGDSFPKRGNFDYIKKKAELTFLEPHHASKELVDEIFSTINDRTKVFHILSLAKSTIKQNLSEKIKGIKKPTLIVWGKQDLITPPNVAIQFHHSIANSRLVWIDQCGHVPMIETPEEFNRIYHNFIVAIENPINVEPQFDFSGNQTISKL